MALAHVRQSFTAAVDDGGAYANATASITASPSVAVPAGNTLFMLVVTDASSIPTVSDDSANSGAANRYVIQDFLVGDGATGGGLVVRCDVSRQIDTDDVITFDFAPSGFEPSWVAV